MSLNKRMTRLFKTVCAHQNIISFKQIKYINVIVVGEKCNDEHWSNGYFMFSDCVYILCVSSPVPLSLPLSPLPSCSRLGR